MYIPGQIPHGNLSAMEQFLFEELQRIAQEFTAQTFDHVQLAVRHVAPARPRDGMTVFADGTNWNPGTGRGVYVYSSGAWVKL